MKKSLLFCISMLMMALAVAGPVNPRQARNIALNFMMQKSSAITRGSSCQLVYTQTNERSADALFYVFNVGEGFVMVSADDAVVPVLGYSPSGHFNPDRIPDNFRAWVQGYADAIEYAKTHELVADAAVQEQWEALEAGRALRGGGTRNAVGPLLTTKWDQEPYFNSLCPEDTDSWSGHVPTGCVATAMAQIINYHEYPAHGFGTHQYYHNTYGLLQADFANTTYQYPLMPDSLDWNSSAAQVNAVATLMHDCGVAVNMDYGPSASSAYTQVARSALVTHFGYEAQLALKYYRYNSSSYGLPIWTTVTLYEDNEWASILMAELNEGRPILYSGDGSDGHAWVCDGYDNDTLLHFNWGWGGSADGYFAIGHIMSDNYNPGDIFTPASGFSFNNNNSVIFMRPGNNIPDTIILNNRGRTTATVNGSALVGHFRAFNQDYLDGPSYSDHCMDTLTLIPSTAGGQLLVEVVSYANQTVTIYEGNATSGTPLMTVNSYSSPVMSTTGAITIVYEGSWRTDGFRLQVSEAVCLPMVYNFNCSGNTYSTADFSWVVYQGENHSDHNFNYSIEYGQHGFVPGTGTVISATGYTASIGGLTAETVYDAYLTYTCMGGETITLGPVTFTTGQLTEICPAPSHLTCTSLNRHSVQVEWFPGYQETTWNVEYGPANFVQGTGTSQTVNGNTRLILTQLAAGLYDLYLQANCGDQTSSWVKTSFGLGSFDCAQIGEGTITNPIFPMGWYSSNDAKYTYTQQIFTAQELSEQGVTGDIFSIAFQYGGTAQTKSPVTVWLGHTSQQSMDYNWIPSTQMQQVFNGTVQLENGWVSVIFDTPFAWDGTSNLVVAFLNNSGSENGTYVSYMHSTSSYMAAEMTRSSYIDINNIGNDVTRVSRRNNMRFCGTGEICTLRRDMEASIIEGETYNFYGTLLSEPGTYQHRWWVSDECDSLVTLHLNLRKIIFVTPTGSGLRNGTSWANAMQLQEAMDTAASFTDRTPYIYVKKGTYTGNQSGTNSFEIKPNVRAYGGFNGNEPADYDLNNRTQANINQTILFGSNTRRVLYQSADFTENTATVFNGFTIRGGTVNTAEEGGGAYIRKYCTMQNCTFTANNAAISGTESNITRSGVAVYNNGGTIRNCEIHNNTINLSGTGSGHKVYGVGVYTQNGVVDNCNIHHNTAIYDGNGNNWNVYGGGIYDYQNSQIRNSTITMNSAAQGGGICTYGYSSSSATYVTNCIISNNTSRSHGGGVYVGNYGHQTFTQCLIGNNAAGGNGGGVYNYNNNGKFVACDIVRNSAVTNGGGLYAYYDCSLQNSIVWGNKVGATNNQLAAGSSHYFNMESSAVQGGYSGAITLEPENTGTGIGYPKFTNPTAEAGVDVNNAIGDWTLQNGSICANMGMNPFVEDLNTDLAGNARIQQERADIGAYESTYGMAFPLHPQTESNIIYVTTTGAGSRDGSSWANATSNLQYAMDVAMNCEPPAAVWVKQGTYTPGRSLVVQPKVAVYGGFVGNEPYTCDLSQRDFTTHATIIDGDSAYRVLDKSCPFASAQSSTGTTYMTEPGIILMPITGSLDITACSGTIYDNGGPENNYSNNCDGQITLRSFNPNSVITLTGSYNIESWDDYLEIYDYEDGEMRYLASYNSSGSISFTSPSSVIVLKFTSDRSSNYAGFEINFTCSNCNPVIPAQEEALFRTGESLFDGLTFQNGFVSSTSDYAGAYLLAGTDMLNCTFSGNHGRGVYAKDCHLDNCVFEENSQYGLYCDGSTNVSNSTAQNNGYYGIYFASTGTLLNSTMKQNNNCGLYITNGKVEGCLVTENGSNNYGVYSSGSNVRIINTSITNNNGGGLNAYYGGLYVNVNIANNSKTRTGTSSSLVNAGVYARNNARFVNCNIVNNKIELVPSSWGDVNRTNAFAGVYNNSINNEYTNCIIWGNKADTAVSNIEGDGTFSYCAVEGGVDGIANITLDAANNGSSSGTSYVKFANPATTAGVTTQNNVDYNLSSGSACINAGNPNTTSLNLPTYDLGGSLRIKQQHIDIGAYEFGDVNIQPINDEICLGESFFYDTYFVYPEEPGLFLDTFIYNSGGLDYIAYINLQVNPVYNENLNVSICQGESYSFNGQTYNATCTQTAYLQTAAGCDSTVVLNLTVNPIVYNEFSYIACDSFVWNQVTYRETGDYIQTLQSATGCDSIVTLHLTVNHSAATEDSMQICRSSLPFYYKGVIIGEETPEHSVISVPLVTTNGCDSVVSMHLTIVDVLTHEFSETACDSYTWAGTTYTTGGDKVKTFTSSLGCDSVVTLHLTIYQSVSELVEVTICDNDLPYHYINGQIDTTFGEGTPDFLTLNFTLSTTHGCDSVVTLHLTVNHVATSTISVVECDSYTWNDSTYTQSGTYQQTFTAANGCDSIVTLNLTINHSVTESVEVIICEAELPYHYVNGQIDTTFEVGTPNLSTLNFKLSTIHGCDSNVVLHVTVIPAYTPMISVSGALTPCQSSSATLGVTGNYSAYEWSNGIAAPSVTITEPGYYWVSVIDSNGCTGTSEMTHVGISDLITETPSICMVGVDNGHNLVVWEELSDPDVSYYKLYRENNQANVFEPLAMISADSLNAYEDMTADPTVRAYRYKITAMDSCGGETPMSAMHKSVHLTINRGIGNSWNLIWSHYEGFEFASYNLYRGTANNNLQLIQTMPSNLNSYTDNLTSMDDALFYQIEVVLPADHHCVRHTRDITYTGTRSNIVYNGVPVTVELFETACDSYEWLGQTLTQSGTYTGTYTSDLGYECNATLHLTITHPEPMSFVREGCESYTPTWADGYSTTYTQSGIYTHGYENADGCWQVDTLHLTIKHAPQVSLSTFNGGLTEIYPGQEITIYNTLHQDGYTYVWSNGDIGEYAGIVVSPLTATTYYVTVSNPPCTATAESGITITITGVEDYDQPVLTLYPNPTSGIVNVGFEMRNEQWKDAEIQIFDMYGKLLRTEHVNDSTIQIDMSLFADGVYTLRIKTQDGVVTRKIVKQR
ncbi:MAG: C10 family peptidase [Bacteroidales bacterium]|nr:C10 family peptidase [Bacteroidales bacterium]